MLYISLWTCEKALISLDQQRCRQMCGQQVYGGPPPCVGGDQWGPSHCSLHLDSLFWGTTIVDLLFCASTEFHISAIIR